jgi:hypothetical protein
MKANRTVILLAIVLVAALAILGIGYYALNPGGVHVDVQTVDVGLNVAVQVLDPLNETPVIGAPVYFVACSPNGTSDRDVHMSGVTEDDGWALFQANFSLDPDQVIYLGASNRKALVDFDFAGEAFNGTGYLGEWKAFNYSLLHNSDGRRAAISGTITVDRDSGKMI